MKAKASRAANPGLWARLKHVLQAGNTPALPAKHGSAASLYAGLAANHAFVHTPGKPVWMGRDYGRFADEGYIKNVIAHRSVNLVAEGAAGVPWALFDLNGRHAKRMSRHPVLTLLNRPNPLQGGAELFLSIYAYRLISGNAYLQAVGPKDGVPLELHVLRPDRVSVIAGKGGLSAGYRHTVGDRYTDFAVNPMSGFAKVLHLKNFHPLNDWYGLSSIEAAAYSIDQHNQAGAWNQALLQNGARPSGALVVNAKEQGGNGHLSEDQFNRLRDQVDQQFSGPANAGRPFLLEGGLEWREMSLSPRDMDFIDAKNSSARDIALAFGVPPQMLGIPGDNTYANLAEARLSLWEQTILPLVDSVTDALNNWLIPQFGGKMELRPDADGISALALRREKVWERVKGATFLSDEEKRELVGLKSRPVA